MANDYYGHHPSPNVADPGDYYDKTEIQTLTAESSANALAQANNYTDTASASLQTYSEEASANAYNQVEYSVYNNPDWNNGWYKEYVMFTTITSGASAAYQIDALPGNILVKADIMGLGLGDKYAAYSLKAYFYMNGASVTKIGATSVLLEEESDPNWNADIDVDVSGFKINIIVQGTLLTEWVVTVEWLLQPKII